MKKIYSIFLIAIILINKYNTFAQLPLDNEGWTIFTPSADSRIIYVDATLGNDANSGLSELLPKKTLLPERLF